MKIKSGLWAIGLFTLASVVTISCGGSSSGDDDDDSAAGKAGQSGVAGATGTAGNPAGTAGSPAGTAGTPAGTAGAGTGGNPAGTAGNQNAGGDDPGPGPGAGGDGPTQMGCPATQPAEEPPVACMQTNNRQPCVYNGTTVCRCQRSGNGQNATRAWACDELNNGAGGDGGIGIPQGACPAMAKTGDTCTTAGQCPGAARCFCNQQLKVQCF